MTLDLVTPQAAIVLHKRRTIALTAWLLTALQQAAEAQLPLFLVTPPDSRLTAPTASVLIPPHATWVISHPNGFYNGLTGTQLTFDGTTFTPNPAAPDPALAFRQPVGHPPLGPNLVITFRIRHSNAIRLAEAVELVYESLTEAPPSGWAASEPIALTWNPDEITTYCHDRAPNDTWICHTGLTHRRAVGMTTIQATTEGIEEHTTLHISHHPHQPTPRLTRTVHDLATDHDLTDLLAHTQPGPADLTTLPIWAGLPTPLGLALGPKALRDICRTEERPPVSPVSVGSPSEPTLWYPFDSNPPPQAWADLDTLVSHLRGPQGRPGR
jgi:hypothetical protein